MKKAITVAELLQLISNKSKLLLLDVRSPEEYNSKHIPDAVNLPIEKMHEISFEKEVPDLVVTICGKGGGRSEIAATLLSEKMDVPVCFLEGGTMKWYDELGF